MQNAGYIPIATFVLPERCWTEHYFEPQAVFQEELLKKQTGNQAAIEFVNSERHEAHLYRKYKAFYGYVFYIGTKVV